jgi:hypothetical protein
MSEYTAVVRDCELPSGKELTTSKCTSELRHAGLREIVENEYVARCGVAIMWPIRRGLNDGAWWYVITIC